MIGSVTVIGNAQGLSFNNTSSVDYPTMPLLSTSLPVGATGVLTTRTDANTGTITMDAAHTITDAARVSIFWLDTDGVTVLAQYKVTVGTVASLSVPFDLGVGEDLPVATTAVVVTEDVELDYLSEVDTLEFLMASATAPTQVVLQSAGGTVVFATTIQGATSGYIWHLASGISIPVSGDVAKAFVTNGSAVSVSAVQVAIGNVAP